MANTDLFECPCRFEVKAMGRWSAELEDRVSSIVDRHLDGSGILGTSSRLSREGNYISVTCVIKARSRAQLDAIYMDLNSEEDIFMKL